MDIRVEQAFELMIKKDSMLLLSQSGLRERCLDFFRFMKNELLPELWLNAPPLFSAQLLDLIQRQSSISFQSVICPYFDLAGEDQFCRRWGYERLTVCAAPHVYPCFWTSREFGWMVRQGLWLPFQLYLTEEEALKEICNKVLQLGQGQGYIFQF